MNLNKRNYPPEHGIRLPAGEMVRLIVSLFEKVGMPRENAALLGDILTRNDLRCLFSHGTRQVPYYLQKIKGGVFKLIMRTFKASEKIGEREIILSKPLSKVPELTILNLVFGCCVPNPVVSSSLR